MNNFSTYWFCKIIFTGNTQIVSRRKKNFKKPSGLTIEDIRGALLRNKVDITQEFGNAPAPVPGSSKLGSVSEFTLHIALAKMEIIYP